MKSIIAWVAVAFIYLIGAMLISDLDAFKFFIAFWPSVTILLLILSLYGVLILYVTLDWNSRY
jgi:hypothetical protein